MNRGMMRGSRHDRSRGPRFRPYPEYRDSGVEWLGQIPAEWDLKRLKYLATFNDEALPETTDPGFEMSYVDIGSVDAAAGLTETESLIFEKAPSRARRIVRDGDVIVSTVRTYLRAIAAIQAAEPNLIVSTGFAVIRPRQIDSAFAAYALRAPHFIERVVANSVGVSYPAINPSRLSCFPLAFPDVEEQRHIVDFLDRETAKTDALVAKKERLIELLQEKRTALITRAVTRGLDPNVPMKDSGIDWLGRIHARWDLRPLWSLCDISTGNKDTIDRVDDGAYPFFIRSPRVERIDTWSFDGEAVLMPGEGDVGEILHYVDAKFDFHQRVYKFSTFRSVLGKFFFYYVGALFRFQVMQGTAKSTVDSLRRPMLRRFPVCVPPRAEQTAIVAALNRATAQIDVTIAKVHEAITLLHEYRTALISAAVTGKIDVRQAAA